MYLSPYGRIKDIVQTMRKLEDKLMSEARIALAEQNRIHERLSQLRKELRALERRTAFRC